MTPCAFTFFVEWSFLVFSTNKLQVIVLFCKYQKKKKKNESRNFFEGKIGILKRRWIFNLLSIILWLVHFHTILKKTFKLEELFKI